MSTDDSIAALRTARDAVEKARETSTRMADLQKRLIANYDAEIASLRTENAALRSALLKAEIR